MLVLISTIIIFMNVIGQSDVWNVFPHTRVVLLKWFNGHGYTSNEIFIFSLVLVAHKIQQLLYELIMHLRIFVDKK